jgi:hypothetical protein
MNPKITVTRLSGFDRNKSLNFESDAVTLGTGAGCDVRFDPTWDKTVSGMHAKLIFESDQVWIVDASEAGTMLDGAVVKRAKIASGGVVELGKGGPKIKIEWKGATPPPLPATKTNSSVAATSGGASTLSPRQPVGAPASASMTPQATRAPATPVRNIPTPAPQPATANGGGGMPSWLVPVLVVIVLGMAAGGWFLFGQKGGGDMTRIASEQSGAVGLVVAVRGNSGPQGIATAWAAAPRVFVTNSHVIESVEHALANGSSVFIVINRDGDKRLRVTGTRMHPKYGQPLLGFEGKQPAVPAFDVGLLLTESDAPKVFKIADQAELERVDSGYKIGYLGFPMEGMAGGGADMRNPVATMQAGIVTSATDFWLAEADFPKRLLIQHNLGAAGGASGSPVFNEDGEVVAVLSAGNVAGLLESADGSLARVPSGVLVNFAQRIDMVKAIWAEYPR